MHLLVVLFSQVGILNGRDHSFGQTSKSSNLTFRSSMLVTLVALGHKPYRLCFPSLP